MDRMENYQHKEASRCNGTAVTYKLHKEEFPSEECLGQRLCPRLSKCRDIHGDLQCKGKTALHFVDALLNTYLPLPMFPTEVESIERQIGICIIQRYFPFKLNPTLLTNLYWQPHVLEMENRTPVGLWRHIPKGVLHNLRCLVSKR